MLRCSLSIVQGSIEEGRKMIFPEESSEEKKHFSEGQEREWDNEEEGSGRKLNEIS